VVDRRTWDAGREGTFRRVACRDIRVEGHCTVRDSLHFRIRAAVGTAVVLAPGPLVDRLVGSSLAVHQDQARDREEDEGLLRPDVLVLGHEEVQEGRAVRLACPLLRLSLHLGVLVFETSRYCSLSTLFLFLFLAPVKSAVQHPSPIRHDRLRLPPVTTRY
jgi:hypothetical protein